jgi:hypothetical protein
MTDTAFPITPGAAYRHTANPNPDGFTAVVTEVGHQIVYFDVQHYGEPWGTNAVTIEKFRADYEPIVMRLTGLHEAAKRAAAQLDKRTDEQKEVDAGRVLDAAFEATPMPAAFGPRDVAGTFAEWIAADQGRLAAFLADHPEAGA